MPFHERASDCIVTFLHHNECLAEDQARKLEDLITRLPASREECKAYHRELWYFRQPHLDKKSRWWGKSTARWVGEVVLFFLHYEVDHFGYDNSSDLFDLVRKALDAYLGKYILSREDIESIDPYIRDVTRNEREAYLDMIYHISFDVETDEEFALLAQEYPIDYDWTSKFIEERLAVLYAIDTLSAKQASSRL